MKTRELFMGEKEAMLKEEEKEGTSIKAMGQTLKHCTENERNRWCTENQTRNKSAKKNWKAVKKKGGKNNKSLWHDRRPPQGKGVTVHRWMKTSGGKNVEAVPQDVNHSSTVSSRRWPDWNPQRNEEIRQKDDGVLRTRGSAHNPKHTSSSISNGKESVMTWAPGTGSLISPIDDVTHDGSRRMNSEAYTVYKELH